MHIKQSLLKIFRNNFKSNKRLKVLFKDNKLAEYHLKRSIYEDLINHYLHFEDSRPYVKITIMKDSSKGTIIGILNYRNNKNKEIFNIHLQHQLNNTLKVDEFLFSCNCRNCGIEEQIYRYLSVIASEAGYTYLYPSNIIYTSNDLFNFSEPAIDDIFSFLNKYRDRPEDIESLNKETDVNEISKSILYLLLEAPLDFNLHDLLTFDDVIKIKEIISKTNRKLSEVDKNYLIKMSRELYCQYNNTSESTYVFREKCVLLSNIVHFLASEKLLIPELNNIILDGCMEKMGAHTVSIICGRQVDPTADQFVDDVQHLDPYADNSIYFQYYSCSVRNYRTEMITPYILLFNRKYKNLSTDEFLSTEDNDLYKKSVEIQIFS